MRTTRRTAVGLAVTAAAMGALVAPSMAMVAPTPPEGPDATLPSPAMTAGRAFCACQGLPFEPLWID